MRRTQEAIREANGQPSQLDPGLLATLALQHPAQDPRLPHPKPWSDVQEELMLYMVATHLAPLSAANLAGINNGVFCSWMNAAQLYEDGSPEAPAWGGVCAALNVQLKRCWDYAERTALSKIAASPQWQASAWLLERIRQSKYALQSALPQGQVTINIGVIAGPQVDQKRLDVSVDGIKRLEDPRRPMLPSPTDITVTAT